jgi:hypothetical protein
MLAAEPESKRQIAETPQALRTLATIVGGKAGAKAEGNAAGALLALGVPTRSDPVSVLAAM